MAEDQVAVASAISVTVDTSKLAGELIQTIRQADQGPWDLAVLFLSPHHLKGCEQVVADIRKELSPRVLIGCTGESIVGKRQEVEGSPAGSLWVARLPQSRIEPVRVTFEPTAEGAAFLGYPDHTEDPSEVKNRFLILLGDPFTFAADQFLARLNDDEPGLTVAGGMASGAFQPGVIRLFLDGEIYADGAVGVLLAGDTPIAQVVSQGCRPIGKPFVVTKSHQNVIGTLGGKPGLTQLEEVFQSLSPEDQRLLQRGLHVGRVVNEYQETFQRGDFLIRNVLGVDQDTGAIAIGDYVRTGQTVQFHVRDAHSASEDLRELLARYAEKNSAPKGALLFTCNGRGSRLFDSPSHDANAVADVLGEVPIAGFFAQGEMGAIGGKNFLHGFTASILLFG